MGQLGQPNGEAFEPFGEVMGGGLAFERGVHGQHDLVHPALFQSGDQRIDGQVLRPDAFKRGQSPAQHMEASGKKPRLIERP